VGDPQRWPCDTPLSVKVGTKFRQQVVVAQSVLFACGLKVTEFVCAIRRGSAGNVANFVVACMGFSLSEILTPFYISKKITRISGQWTRKLPACYTGNIYEACSREQKRDINPVFWKIFMPVTTRKRSFLNFCVEFLHVQASIMQLVARMLPHPWLI
jgi:hypothetical protein